MKTHYLIFIVTALFVVLFYNQSIGINLSILGVVLSVFTYLKTPIQNKTIVFYSVFVSTWISHFAFAWFGDFISAVAIFTSLFLLAFISKTKELKSVLVIPVFGLNFITFIYRFFMFKEWIPKNKHNHILQKTLAIVLIPIILISIFFVIYTYGSNHFANLFTDFHWDINIWQVIILAAIGFYLAFNFFHFKVYGFMVSSNQYLKNDFINEDKRLKPTYHFMNLDLERLSGVISFLSLIILLIFFIVSFNYEQFVQLPKEAYQLSEETHERVGAVITSIAMAIIVIMFYFKGSFNFDKNAKWLKILAQIWIILNAILVLSAFAKNTEYVLQMGLTYKRVGVYAFLVLALLGLWFTLLKIKNQKTNAYLINQMVWYFYGCLLACSFINWGYIITFYNLKNQKASYEFHENIFYNQELLQEYYPNKYNENYELEKEENSSKPFLSKVLYYIEW